MPCSLHFSQKGICRGIANTSFAQLPVTSGAPVCGRGVGSSILHFFFMTASKARARSLFCAWTDDWSFLARAGNRRLGGAAWGNGLGGGLSGVNHMRCCTSMR